MKKVITLCLTALLTLSLVACGGTGGAAPKESDAPEATRAVTATPPVKTTPTPEPAAEPLDSIELDFADLVLEQAGIAEQAKADLGGGSGISSVDEEGSKAIYLSFKIKNTSAETIDSWDFVVGNVTVGEYTYKTDSLNGVSGSGLEPLKTIPYVVYAQIPDELVDAGEPFVFNIGCNDMFAMEWDTEVSTCTYQYTYTVTKNGDAFEVEVGGATGEAESASGRAGTLWTQSYYVDEFNEPTEEAFVVNTAHTIGTFSNSATTDSLLYGDLLVDKENIAIMLYEYGRSVVKNSFSRDEGYDIKMKAADGTITDMQGWIWSGNDRIVIDEAYRDDVITALSALPVGDVAFVSFSIVESNTPTTKYRLVVPMSNFGDVIGTLAE